MFPALVCVRQSPDVTMPSYRIQLAALGLSTVALIATDVIVPNYIDNDAEMTALIVCSVCAYLVIGFGMYWWVMALRRTMAGTATVNRTVRNHMRFEIYWGRNVHKYLSGGYCPICLDVSNISPIGSSRCCNICMHIACAENYFAFTERIVCPFCRYDYG